MKTFAVRSFSLALLLAAPVLVTAGPLEKCAVIAKKDGKESLTLLASLRVIEMTAKDGAFVLPADAPPHVSAVQCGRQTLVPATNDYKVLLAGYPFIIVSPDERLLFMELIDGRLQVSTRGGELTEVEIPPVQAYVNKAQEYFYVDKINQESRP